ncbi:MAG TPA: aminoglycoside phosphotransferase family protein [Pyrinomonadaceae bacterium]|jgi:hygromycin-B 7''-O-kinase
MGLRLPDFSSAAEFELHFNGAVWRDAAREICRRSRLAHATLRRSPQGENIIFFVDEEYVIKIFGPSRDNHRREAAALEFARGKAGIRTPELLHAGDIEGWPYLVMTRLPGHASREVWESVGRGDRREIISRLGRALRELHTHGAPLLTPLDRDWRGFIERQARGAVTRQSAAGANPEWLERLPAYVAERLPLLPADGADVFLHGDVHAGNLLLSQERGRWVISGLVDFGDSLCGFGEYEFVAPGVLMVQGDGELQRELLLAYGYPEGGLDPVLRARLMLLTILYECSDLRKYALRLDPGALNLTLDQLERAIWRFTTD